jgi:hypothetical protein
MESETPQEPQKTLAGKLLKTGLLTAELLPSHWVGTAGRKFKPGGGANRIWTPDRLLIFKGGGSEPCRRLGCAGGSMETT